MKKNIILLGAIFLFTTSCSLNKKIQGKIKQDFTDIAGITGKLKNDSLFRITVFTQSTFTEYISVFNIHQPSKAIVTRYNDNLLNYLTILDTVKKTAQNNSPDYQENFSKAMNYIVTDVKDKSSGACATCPISDYRPVLVGIKVKVIDKNGSEATGYKAFMKPVLTESDKSEIFFYIKKDVVPGYYEIRIEKEGKIIARKKVHLKNQAEEELITFRL